MRKFTTNVTASLVAGMAIVLSAACTSQYQSASITAPRDADRYVIQQMNNKSLGVNIVAELAFIDAFNDDDPNANVNATRAKIDAARYAQYLVDDCTKKNGTDNSIVFVDTPTCRATLSSPKTALLLQSIPDNCKANADTATITCVQSENGPSVIHVLFEHVDNISQK